MRVPLFCHCRKTHDFDIYSSLKSARQDAEGRFKGSGRVNAVLVIVVPTLFPLNVVQVIKVVIVPDVQLTGAVEVSTSCSSRAVKWSEEMLTCECQAREESLGKKNRFWQQ